MRQKIRKAIEEVFARLCPEYRFRTGFITDIANGGFDLPCVWLCPLDLEESKGRSEGRATYSGVMYLFRSRTDVGPDERDCVWDRMELEARRALVAAIGEEVLSIEGIAAEVDENAYTGYGELSLRVSFRVIVDFCDGRE